MLVEGEFAVEYDTQVFSFTGKFDNRVSNAYMSSVSHVWLCSPCEMNQDILACFKPCAVVLSPFFHLQQRSFQLSCIPIFVLSLNSVLVMSAS